MDENATLVAQESLTRAVDDVTHGLLPRIETAAHNLAWSLSELTGTDFAEEELRRSIARGVALALTAIANGDDPCITPPVIHSATPTGLLADGQRLPPRDCSS